MAKKNEVEETALAIPAELVDADEDRFAGMTNVLPSVDVIKHNYLGRIFIKGKGASPADRFDRLEGMVIRLHGTAFKNFESDYDKDDPLPPTCYSVDGVHGARPRETRKLPVAGHQHLYGDCADCFFGKWGSAGSWKGKPGKGIQCSRYGLVFLMLPDGRPAVLQVPPTSNWLVQKQIQHAISTINRGSLTNLVFEFLPSGGGNEGNSIAVTPVRAATLEQVNQLKDYRIKMASWMDNFILNFASGGNPVSNNPGAAEENDTAI